MPGAEIPISRQLRWPILVVLDQGAEEDPILDLPERVASHLELAPEAMDVLDLETGCSLLERRRIAVVDHEYRPAPQRG
jgi:hypothetical protein